MIDLEEVKKSPDILFSVLGIDGPGNHKKCPFHHDSLGSMQVNSRNGIWFWKCHGGCGSGTVIDAYMKRHGLATSNEAIKQIEKELGFRFSKEDKINEGCIEIDEDRAEAFIELAHKRLMDDPDLQIEYMAKKRGIEIFIVEQYKIGFITNRVFKEWPQWKMPAAWVLPIRDKDKKLRAVKLHFEIRPDMKDFKTGVVVPNGGPKCLFAPFGIKQPWQDKPKHSFVTFWPPPEDSPKFQLINGQKVADWMYLCPGELKALAYLSNACYATSATVGENGIDQIKKEEWERLSGRYISLPYDDDEPDKNTGKRPGFEWKEKMIEKVKPYAIEIESFTLGKK